MLKYHKTYITKFSKIKVMKRERIEQVLDEFNKKKVIVLGDFYLDEYLHCNAEKLSPEAPVPRAVIKKVEHIPGCAGNVAVSLKSLGAQVICAGTIGNDEKGNILRNKLLEKGIITSGLMPDASRVTGVFSRILLKGSGDLKQHSIRFDLENEEQVSGQMHDKLSRFLEENLENVDMLIIADYDEAKDTGLMTVSFIKKVTKLAKEKNVPLAGQSRLKIKEFKDFKIIFCNQKEAAEAVNDQNNSAEKLLQETSAEIVVVTEGKDGLIILNKDNKVKIPSYANKIVDVCGAGDSLSSAFCLASLTDATEEEKGFIASHAAAVSISKPGTAPVFQKEIIATLSKQDFPACKIVRDQNLLLQSLTKLKKQGKKIVFTNGYFDIISSGQVRFLQKAKEHGNILVVAVNSDRSTRENKGEGRPLINEEERLEILSAMNPVDFLTIFDESTPLKIISFLKPDVLAKGREHNSEEVVGKDIVENNGGEVKIIFSDK